MNLRTYTLSVSLAAIVGLLLTVVPLIRNALEYRSPSPELTEPHELSSLEAFVVAKGRNANEVSLMLTNRNGWYGRFGNEWQAIYDAAKAQHADAVRQQVESKRQRAVSNLAAYGTLCALCVLLLITHLLWARRALTDRRGGNL